jgi:ribosomal protein S18 acetylase RimI-like enzyme
MQIKVEICELNNHEQASDYVRMINEYMVHPMGGETQGHDEETQLKLIKGLKNNPSTRCFFLVVDGIKAGISTCFVNFSTFKIKPYLYIHDFFISEPFRGKNLSKYFLSYLIEYAKDQEYCKVTLEVRCDNNIAQGLYRSLGFKDCEPIMYFWSKSLG